MKFLVAETIHYSIEAEDGESAIAARKFGEGTVLPNQTAYRASVWNGNQSLVVNAVHESDWPLWAKGLKLLASPEDKGIGDVLARIIGTENSEAFKMWYKKTFGKDCVCNGRQAAWNAQYPLN